MWNAVPMSLDARHQGCRRKVEASEGARQNTLQAVPLSTRMVTFWLRVQSIMLKGSLPLRGLLQADLFVAASQILWRLLQADLVEAISQILRLLLQADLVEAASQILWWRLKVWLLAVQTRKVRYTTCAHRNCTCHTPDGFAPN